MQYRTGKRTSKLIIAANNSGELLILRPSSIKPIIAINPKEANIRIINSAPEAFTLLLLLITNSNLSLSKKIEEFLFANQILPAIANQDKIMMLVTKATPTPPTKMKRNIKFQKLSLLSLALIKLRIRLSHLIFNHYLNFSTYLLMLVGFSKYLQNFIKVEEVFFNIQLCGRTDIIGTSDCNKNIKLFS